MQEEIRRLKAENEQLRQQVSSLEEDLINLSDENDNLLCEIEMLQGMLDESMLDSKQNLVEHTIDNHLNQNFVASNFRQHFHRPTCQWAQYFLGRRHCVVFNSHEAAVAAGKKPCKTCKA